MRIQLILAFVTLFFIPYLNGVAIKGMETTIDNDYYGSYDDDPLDDLDLDDEMGTDVNVIGRGDELRQIILNPRKRRERRRKYQGKNSKKK